jgi:hypothetical protein
MTIPTPPNQDPLGVALKKTEAKLVEKLEEACEPEPTRVTNESTAELAKLSDSLLAAARAAKDVVSLRQRRRSQRGETGEPEAIREFTDRDGRAWRVWAVTPSHLRGRRDASLGEFEEGWLAFETLDESARKRLPHYPADWQRVSESRLQELLGLALEVPARRGGDGGRTDPRAGPPA